MGRYFALPAKRERPGLLLCGVGKIDGHLQDMAKLAAELVKGLT